MKKLLLILCLSLIATHSHAAAHLEYQDTREAKTIRYTIIVIEETPDTITYASLRPESRSEYTISKINGDTLKWKSIRNNRTINAVRKGNTIEVNATENGQIKSKTIIIGDKVWIQRIALSLQWFVKDSSKDKINFSIIRPADLSLFDMVAIKKNDIDILVTSKNIKATNVIVTLSGMKSILWKSNYWFQKDDGLFLKYEGTEGPGTPATITILVTDLNSSNTIQF